MLKKPFALVLIAVGLIITPGAALADVIIPTLETNKQGDAAISENINKIVSESTKNQNRTQKIRTSRALRRVSCLSKTRGPSSNRVTMQSTTSTNNSTTKQTSTITSSQHQMQKNHTVLCR